MKTLKDGSIVFYRKRWYYFFYSLLTFILGCVFLLMSMLEVITGDVSFSQNYFHIGIYSSNPGISNVMMVIAALIFFVISAISFTNVLKIKPYVKLNETSIELQSPDMAGFFLLPPVMWEDIYEAFIGKIIVGSNYKAIHRALGLKVRDLDSYKKKLSFFEKTTANKSEDIFYIDLDLMPKEDADILLNEISRHITLTDLIRTTNPLFPKRNIFGSH